VQVRFGCPTELPLFYPTNRFAEQSVGERFLKGMIVGFVLRAFLLLGFGALLITPARPKDKTGPATIARTLVSQNRVEAPIPLPKDLIDFFVGEWSGTGAFANGKKSPPM